MYTYSSVGLAAAPSQSRRRIFAPSPGRPPALLIMIIIIIIIIIIIAITIIITMNITITIMIIMITTKYN